MMIRKVKKMSLFAMMVVACGQFMNVPSALAQRTEDVKVKYVDHFTGGKFDLKEKLHIDFDGWAHVEKLRLKVKGPIPGLTVASNGVNYTPVYVPGSNGESYYECPIHSSVNGVDVSASQPAYLGPMEYDYVNRPLSVPPVAGWYAVPTEEIERVIGATEGLSQFVSLTDQQQYLLPIKVAAGHALALEYGRGDYSMKTNQAIQALIAQVDYARPLIESELQIDAAYSWAVYLLSIKERLSQITE